MSMYSIPVNSELSGMWLQNILSIKKHFQLLHELVLLYIVTE